MHECQLLASLGRTTSPRSRTQGTDTPASPSLARGPTSAGPASLLSELWRPTARPQPAPARPSPCAGAAGAREGRARVWESAPARPFTLAPRRGVRARGPA